MRCTPRRLTVGSLAVLSTFVTFLSACDGKGGGNSGGGPATATALVSLSYKDGTVSGTGECSQYQITWKLEPVTLNGTDGSSNPVTISKTYTARKEPESGGFRCYYDEPGPAGLKTGNWKISMNYGTCTEALTPGLNQIHFAQQSQGCTKGSSYPGQ